MTPFQIMSALRKEFQSNIESCITLARNARQDENGEWDDYLKSLAITPISADDRKQRYDLNPTIQTGALPLELRMAVECHVNTIRQTMNTYKNEFGHHDWWTMRVETPFLKVVNDVQHQTLSDYIGSVQSESLATTILQNAGQVSYGYFETTVRPTSKSHQCPACRAARPAETDLTTCSFCGSSLFT